MEPDLVYPEHPIKIVDYKTRVTRNQTSNFYKVQWSNHSEREATWEMEEFIQSNYPELLQTHQGTPSSIFLFNLAPSLNLGTRFLLGGRIVTPQCLTGLDLSSARRMIRPCPISPNPSAPLSSPALCSSFFFFFFFLLLVP